MQEHVMIDIETLGMQTEATPVVCAIGAVKFDLEIGIIDRFYYCCEWQGSVNLQTIAWWMKQSDEARQALFNGPVAQIAGILIALKQFVNDNPVWGNGSDFDNLILLNWYNKLDINGWSYKQNRCFRTIKNIYNDSDCYIKPVISHHAMYDAEAQALTLINIAKKYNLPI